MLTARACVKTGFEQPPTSAPAAFTTENTESTENGDGRKRVDGTANDNGENP